jgi:hypothetical protein
MLERRCLNFPSANFPNSLPICQSVVFRKPSIWVKRTLRPSYFPPVPIFLSCGPPGRPIHPSNHSTRPSNHPTGPSNRPTSPICRPTRLYSAPLTHSTGHSIHKIRPLGYLPFRYPIKFGNSPISRYNSPIYRLRSPLSRLRTPPFRLRSPFYRPRSLYSVAAADQTVFSAN